MTRTLFDQIVMTDYGHFAIIIADDDPTDGDIDSLFRGQHNGWVGAVLPGIVHVNLAKSFGGSSMTIELHDERPQDPDWEDCVEVSCVVPQGANVRCVPWDPDAEGEVIYLPAGKYRLRASARGRDAGGAKNGAPEIVDFYLLQLWPAEPSTDTVIRSTSRNSNYWNNWASEIR